ncbi:uncharacterized protein LOC119374651 isoform X3 [Rhipicephalus sanguineus]|uniref:uncharacterized protein LOC119374651 isoform X3 n=1 Tax=Rhipicephalus sanguineus TaxID=34632 RepID=UPI001895D0AF|nr:uncharacterized protein LOC119374651 isoform X3 [Rhipicephalus sanguineus]
MNDFSITLCDVSKTFLHYLRFAELLRCDDLRTVVERLEAKGSSLAVELLRLILAAKMLAQEALAKMQTYKIWMRVSVLRQKSLLTPWTAERQITFPLNVHSFLINNLCTFFFLEKKICSASLRMKM